jgi:hypothetical protein
MGIGPTHPRTGAIGHDGAAGGATGGVNGPFRRNAAANIHGTNRITTRRWRMHGAISSGTAGRKRFSEDASSCWRRGAETWSDAYIAGMTGKAYRVFHFGTAA